MLLYVFLFTVIFFLSAFGITYLLLRTTPYASYSALLSIISFQPLMVIGVSLFGYRPPIPLKSIYVTAPMAGGVVLTLIVIAHYRAELVALLRATWKVSALIYALAMVSMAIATPLLFGTSLAYIDWANGELVNYSYFAHAFLGMLHDPNYVPSFEQSVSARFGAELFLATLSAATGKPPLLLVEVLSALHKASAIIAFAVGCEFARRERGLLPIAVIVASVGFAFASILSLNHVLAFLAAQAVTPSFILLSLSFLFSGIRSRRVQVFLAAHVIFSVITYGEGLPFLGIVAGVAFLEAVYQRRRGIPVALLSIFGMGCLVNPVLTYERLDFVYRLRLAKAGFDVLGSPRTDLVGYMAAALGLQYRYVDVPAVPHMLLLVGVVLGLAVVISAFVVAAVRQRMWMLLTIPLLILVAHLTVTDDWPSYYRSYKTIAALYFFNFFALALMLDTVIRRRPWRRLSGLPEVALLGSAVLFIAMNAVASTRAANFIRTVPSTYFEADIQRALSLPGAGTGPVLVLAEDVNASFWDLMANFQGSPRLLLDRAQALAVYHNGDPTVIEPMAVPGPVRTEGGSRVLFDGRMILPAVGSYTPVPQAADVDATLKSASPGLRLNRRRTLFSTSAFRVIEGSLVDTGKATVPTDASPNQPPALVGVSPNQGQGSDALFAFTFTDANGSGDIFAALVNITSGQGAYECYLSYNRAANQVGLVLDGGKAWDAALVGSHKTLENSLCSVDAASSSTADDGDQFTLRLALSFKRAFVGHKTIHATVADRANLTTGWHPVGFWDVR